MRVSTNSAIVRPRKLPPEFYFRATKTVARQLLGKILCRRLDDGTILKARITETEAYEGARDRAAHTYGGRRTARVAPMWGEGGQAYVYLIYGLHECLNVVTRREGQPEAVLVRAADPLQGHDFWGRQFHDQLPSQWMRGPGKLCKALRIGRSFSGMSFQGDRLWIEDAKNLPPSRIAVTARIGVDYAGEHAHRPLRFFDKKGLTVSGSKRQNSPEPAPAARRSRQTMKSPLRQRRRQRDSR